MRMTSRRREIIVACLVVTIAWLAVWPVLRDPRVCILDCPSFFEAAEKITWYDVRTYVWRAHPARSAYGMMLYWFPIYVWPSVAVRFWVHSGLLLGLTQVLIYLLVRQVTASRIAGFLAALLSLGHIAFAENYYTMFKGEPWLLAGIMVLTYHLWRLRATDHTWRAAVAWHTAAILSAFAVYSIKETGLAFLPVYVAGLVLVGWMQRLPLLRVLQRAWVPLAAQILFAGIAVWLYLNLPVTFGVGTAETYQLTWPSVRNGTLALTHYMLTVSPYALLAAFMVLAQAWQCYRARDEGTRRVLGWQIYFALLCISSYAILVPWTAVSPRYYLVGNVAGIVWSVLACVGAARMAFHLRGWVRWAQKSVVAVTWCLLVAHAAFSFIVNHISEGRVQQRFDAAYDEMFRYVAAHTAPSGIVAFVQSPRQIEARQGLPILLRILYKRGNIRCICPTAFVDYLRAELICVPDRVGPLNYFRLPASENEGWHFIQTVATNPVVQEIHRLSSTTTIWYVTTEFGKPQYKSWLGIPAFWALKRGSYELGWRFYEPAAKLTNGVSRQGGGGISSMNLIRNSQFEEGLQGWSYWGSAGARTGQVSVVCVGTREPAAQAVRIMTLAGELSDVAQGVRVRSGEVYRLSATVRSLQTNASDIGFGARVAFFLPPQPEWQLVWMSEYNHWWRRECVFTTT